MTSMISSYDISRIAGVVKGFGERRKDGEGISTELMIEDEA